MASKFDDDPPPDNVIPLLPPDEENDEPLPAEFSEDALAVQWVKRHSKQWRYVAQFGTWYESKGDHWQSEKTSKCFELARNLTREALMWPGLTPAARLRVNSAKTASAMLQFVKADRAIALTPDAWDTRRDLVGIPGGIIDLNTCSVCPPDAALYITKRCAVAPAKGEPKRWMDFLRTVTNDSPDIINYLHRFSGYAMSGETGEHALAFLYGTGANGKTTFVETLMGILGDYAITAPIETFAESKNERHSTELARLRGARLVVTEETSSGSRWNESRIKILTGGNRISARFMRQDDFEYTPEFKLMIAGNHKPQMRSVDEAMKRRMHIIPFTVKIPESERIKKYGETILKPEWPQILNWMIEGHYAWKLSGLAPPEAITDATERYLKSNDVLQAWIDERCEIIDHWSSGKALYADFSRWCEEQGETLWKRRGWSDAMVDKGFPDGRSRATGNQERGFSGLKLRLSVSHVNQEKSNVY